MDVRTTEALFFNDYLKNKNRTEKNFLEHYRAIIRIKESTNKSLRDIDRALMAYHKSEIGIEKSNFSKASTEVKPKYEESIEKYIIKDYGLSVEEFMKQLANQYIDDDTQKNIFLSSGVWTKVRLNYLASLILSSRGREFFSPKEIMEVIREELIPSLSEIEDQRLSGWILTQDVHKDSKSEYNNEYYCLEKVSHGQYKFIGLNRKSIQH
ncbi:MAG: hypothetical protein WAX07_04485 [Candidatus Altiarchaeia archaeon]